MTVYYSIREIANKTDNTIAGVESWIMNGIQENNMYFFLTAAIIAGEIMVEEQSLNYFLKKIRYYGRNPDNYSRRYKYEKSD